MKNIKSVFFVFQIIFFIFMVNNQSSFAAKFNLVANEDSSVYIIPPKIYRIMKIKEEKKFYIIYAKRDEKIYKIVSIKDTINCSKKHQIHRHKEYLLALESYFARYDRNGMRLPHPGETGASGLWFWGVTVYIEETENNVWDLFNSPNLRGLCIEENISN